jgi:hypothetical protein
MARNDFIPFATDGDANVEDQATWVNDPVRAKGFFSGWTKSFQLNKAIRQAGFVAASISEWVNQVLVSVDINDDGNEQEWVNDFDAAIRSRFNSFIAQLPPPTRMRPLGALTVYVDIAAGLDGNDGLTPGTAFQHIQRAIDYMLSNVDLGPNYAYISVASGTYYENLSIGGPLMGQKGIQYFQFLTRNGPVYVQGNGYTVAAFGGAEFFFNGDWHFGCTWSPQGPNSCIGGYSCRIGAYGGNMIFENSPGCFHVFMGPGGEFTAQVPCNYRINGGQATVHWYSESGGRIIVADNNISCDGNPLFTNYFAWAADCGVILPLRLGFPGGGNVSGMKYLANLNGVINTSGGGVGYLPGSTPGATGSGGQYV